MADHSDVSPRRWRRWLIVPAGLIATAAAALVITFAPPPILPTGLTVVDGASSALAGLPIVGAPPTSPAIPGFHCDITRTGEYQTANPGVTGIDAQKLQAALNYAC